MHTDKNITAMNEYDITHDEAKHEFYLTENGMKAYTQYALTDTSLDIRHTIVPPQLEGKGIAAALVKAAYDHALSKGLKPLATCSYAARWLERHPQYGGCKSSDWHEGSCGL